jgi:hypothetical protein
VAAGDADAARMATAADHGSAVPVGDAARIPNDRLVRDHRRRRPNGTNSWGSPLLVVARYSELISGNDDVEPTVVATTVG